MAEDKADRTKQLWAPWRLQYIVTTDDKPQDGCFLCRYCEAGPGRDLHVIAQDDDTIVVLNRFPYNNGHLLIGPCAHKAELDELNDSELLGCMRQLQRMIRLLRKMISPDGFNIGLNLGRVAGAGLPGHLHWHLVPRWLGDTNFMPVIADTKVIPQSLEALSELLRSALAAES
ncbi:MAG TPA: HIT domain-containing protein [Planctomycetaceae bacterium]|nr:HIT domain-containing protein [Planctomycetaceae bacterium]